MNKKYTDPDAKIENKPRKLTPVEIEYIVDVIPLANRIFPKIAEKVRFGFQDRLRYLLGKINLSPGILVPDPESGHDYGEGIIRMKNEIIRQYRDSQVMAGKSVGILAAGAFGEIMTQSTLNTFHSIGKNSNTTTGIRGFREIINVSKDRSNPSSTVHFIDKSLDLRGVLNLRNEIIYTTVKTLVVDYGTMNYQIFLDDGLPYWYNLYLHLYNMNNSGRNATEILNNSGVFLRLYLDTTAMYSKGITMKELCQQIERKEIIKDDPPPSVLCIPSPFNVGILDIYPNTKNIPSVCPQTMESIECNRAFISISVMSSLDKIALRGIKGIIGLDPAHYSLVLTIEDQEYIGDQVITTSETTKVRKKWKLSLSRRIFKLMGLGIRHIKRLLEAAGIDIIDEGEPEGAIIPIWVLMPEVEDENPIDRIKEIIDDLKEDRDKNILRALVSSITGNIERVEEKWLATIDLKELKRRKTDMNQIQSVLEGLKFLTEILYPKSNLSATIQLKFVIPPTMSPKSLIGKSINEDRKESEKSRESGKPKPPSELKKASRYYYAFTIDSNVSTLTQNNLSELLQKDFVDPRYTYSNNVRFNLDEFGIEAARNFLIKEFLDVISADGSSVNIQHILLIVDYMTRTGSITKISMTMVNKSMGTLGKITVANAMKELLTAAAFGVVDKISGVSASIMVGKHANIGTVFGEKNISEGGQAYAEYKEYEKALAKVKEQLRTGIFSLHGSQFNQAVEEMIHSDLGLESGPVVRPPNINYFQSVQPEPNNTIITPYNTVIPENTRVEIPSYNILPPPKIYSNHIQNIITSMVEAPCAPSIETTTLTQINIPSEARTTGLSLVGGEIVTFNLPIPNRATGINLTMGLIDRIEEASKINLS